MNKVFLNLTLNLPKLIENLNPFESKTYFKQIIDGDNFYIPTLNKDNLIGLTSYVSSDNNTALVFSFEFDSDDDFKENVGTKLSDNSETISVSPMQIGYSAELMHNGYSEEVKCKLEINPKNIGIEVFFSEKELNEALTKVLEKEALDLHKINGSGIRLLDTFGNRTEFEGGDEYLGLDNFTEHKLFNSILMNNTLFTQALNKHKKLSE